MYAPRTSFSFTLGNEPSLVCDDLVKLKPCQNCIMPNCLPKCNNIRKPFSHFYLGVFWIMDNLNLLWICIIYLCLRRSFSFSIENPIKFISIMKRRIFSIVR